MRRLVTATNHVLCALTAIAWLAAAALPATAQQEAERQTRLLLPRAATQTGPTLMLQAAHIGPATCMALRADGKKLASGGEDGYAIIYDVETGVVERTFPWHPCALTSVSLSPDGHYLACGLTDGQVVIWDLSGKDDPEVLEERFTNPQVKYSPHGGYLATWDYIPRPQEKPRRPNTWGLGGPPPPAPRESHLLITRCDASRASFSSPFMGLEAVCFANDDSLSLVVCEREALVTDFDHISPEAHWRPVVQLGPKPPGDNTLYGLDAGAMGPGNSAILVGGGWPADRSTGARTIGVDGAGLLRMGLTPGLRDWGLVDLATGAATRMPRYGDVTAITPDGARVVEVGRDAWLRGPQGGRLTDLRTGATRELASDTNARGLSVHVADVVARDVVVTPDGRKVVAAFDAEAGAFAAPSDGGHLMRQRSTVGAITWDLATGDRLDAWWVEPTREAVTQLHPAPEGNGLTVGLSSGALVRWDLAGGAPPPRTVTPERTRSFRFSPDLAAHVSATTSDGRYVAELSEQRQGPFRLSDACTGERVAGLMLPIERERGPRSTLLLALWVSPDRRTALTVHRDSWVATFGTEHRGSADVRIRQWSLPDGAKQAEQTLPCGAAAEPPLCVFSSRGPYLAWALPGTRRVTICDVLDPSATVTIGHEGADITCLCFGPDGRTLVVGREDGSVVVSEVATSRPIARFSGHLAPVSSACFTADGRLATGSGDGSVALWDTRHWLRWWAQSAVRRGLGRRWTLAPVRQAAGAARLLATGLLGWAPFSTAPGALEPTADPPLSAALYVFAAPAQDRTSGASAQFRPQSPSAAPPFMNPTWGLPPEVVDELFPGDAQGGEERTDPEWLVAIPQGCYDASPGASSRVAWALGDRVYPFDQFEDTTRRPDVVRSVLAGRGIPRGARLGLPHAPPIVTFRSPDYGSGATPPDTPVTVSAEGARPIQRIALYVNGRPAAATLAAHLTAPTPVEGERVFTCNVPVPASGGDLRLRAVAYDVDGLSSRPVELLLRGPGSGTAPKGGLLVLSIGVSKYVNQAWNTIQYAGADASATADLLASQAGRISDRQVLVDEAATVSSVKFALRRLKDASTENDTAVVFIAGHGVQGPSDEYYFLCHDSVEADLPNTALPWRDFVNLLAETRARRVILFADTCHAGFVTGRDSTEWRADRLNREGGVMVFAASKGDEASIEGEEWKHGAFTYALLEGLQGRADQPDAVTKRGDGQVTTAELGDYVAARVAELTNDRQHPLTRLDQFPTDEPIIPTPTQ